MNGENHNDNQHFVLDVPADLGIMGDIYYEITYLEGSAQFTGWIADGGVAEGVEAYVGGNLAEGSYASSIVVGVAVPEGGDEPTVEYYDNYNVPMDTWVVTGHAAGLTSKDKEGHGPMVAAGGLDLGALLHQGSVGLGEVDLSKYSKVVIKYGIDNSQGTIDKHTANGTNRIMLTTADNAMTMAPGGDIISYVDYTPAGWALTTIEIDLTEVDYNGNVFLTWDTLEGTFMLIGSVEFIGAEIPAAPVEPEA